MESILSILYLAKKYMLTPLLKKIASFLEENMNAKNVCLFLPHADILDDIQQR